jgi:hypothetical protein
MALPLKCIPTLQFFFFSLSFPIYFLIFVVLGIELRALGMLEGCLTTRAILPAFFALVIFGIDSHK